MVILSMVPWHSEYSWALVIINEHSRGLMVPRQLSLNCLRMLLRAHEGSRVLKTAPLCSWLRKRWIKKHIKCQLLKWLPCSNLQISQSRFHQIIKWWIFSNSTRKGQLKNVQDGIPWCCFHYVWMHNLRGTYFWDTLYYICNNDLNSPGNLA